MEGSKESPSVREGQPCDICGVVGFPELLSSCSICRRSCVHRYCMGSFFEDPDEWFCEACQSRTKPDVKEQAPNNQRFSCLRGSSNIIMQKNSQISNKNWKGGKVVFLSAEDVATLPSGTKTTASTIQCRLDSQTNSVKTLCTPISKNTPVSVTEASKRFCLKLPTHGSSKPSEPSVSSGQSQLQESLPRLHDLISKSPPVSTAAVSERFTQKSPTNGSSGPSRSSVLVSGPTYSSVQPQAKTTSQLHDEISPLHSPHKFSSSGSLRTKGTEVMSDFPPEQGHKILSLTNARNAGVEFTAKLKPKEPQLLTMDKPAGKQVHTSPNKELACLKNPMSSSRTASSPQGQSKSLSRLEMFPDNFAINALWKGSFEITNILYEGLEAHPPNKVHRKAYEVSKQMPKILKFDIHPRRDMWPEIFHIASPSEGDIALYFLPSDLGSRSKDKYACLVESIQMEDLTMRSSLNGVELLVFSSKQLPMDSQRINMQFYLWGVFRPTRKPICSKPLSRSKQDECVCLSYYHKVGCSLNIFKEEYAKIVDMKNDMLREIDFGKIDKPVERSNLEGKKVSFNVETSKGKSIESNALDRHKHSDRSCPLPSSIVKIEQPLELQGPPGFSKIDNVDAVHKGLNENPLSRTPVAPHDLSFPPGFSLPLHLKEVKLEVQTSACNLESSPPCPRPLKMKQKDDLSGFGNIAEKAAMVDFNAVSVQASLMTSIATDSTTEKDVIQCKESDGLLSSPSKSSCFRQFKKKRSNRESIVIKELEKKESSSKQRFKTVAECLVLFPKVES